MCRGGPRSCEVDTMANMMITPILLKVEWSYLVRCIKFIALYNAIALKCAFSLSHSNRVRFECDKLHFITLKAHFTFIVGISIYLRRGVVF
jgi:hypothetical protein